MATNTWGGTFRENFLRIVAVIGLIAILLLGAWGIIQIAFYLPTLFGNAGSSPKETLSVSVPGQTTSNQAFVLSWAHSNKSAGAYSYSVSYACAAGLSFAAPVPTGSYELVPCNTPFNYISATSSTPLVPVLAAGTSHATTTFTVSATQLADGTITAHGTGATMINAAPATTAPAATTAATKPAASTAKPSSTYVASGNTTNLYGYPDLAVQIVSAPQSAQAGARITLQFVVTNLGTNAARSGWTFNASLPYNPVYTYTSGAQQALYPGDKIVYTLGYNAAYGSGYSSTAYPTYYNNYPTVTGSCNMYGPCAVPGYNSQPSYYSYSANSYGQGQAQATITVDPYNYVVESSKANNSATATYSVY